MSEPLRLVKLLPFWGERFGGSVSQARLICRALAERGHAVTVITSELELPAAHARGVPVEVDGYRVIACTARSWHSVPPYLPPPGMADALRAALANTDVLCVHVGLALTGALGGRLARAANVPFVYNAEGALDPVRLQLKRWRKAIFLRMYERPLLARAAAVQALSAADATFVQQQGVPAANITTIPNAVDAARWAAPADGAAFRARHGLPPTATVVLFAGRLHALKGLDLLLASLAPLLRQRPDLRLAIAGPDDGVGLALQREAGTAGVAAQLHMLGALSPTELHAAMHAADVFALTSRSEGLPVAPLEAAAAGLPLWLTDACRLPEVATWQAGVIAAPDPAALRAAVLPLLDDQALRHRFGANAARMAREHFAVPAVASALESLYRRVCGRG